MQDARLEVVTARSKRDTPHEKASHEVAASVDGRLQSTWGTGGVNSAWGMGKPVRPCRWVWGLRRRRNLLSLDGENGEQVPITFYASYGFVRFSEEGQRYKLLRMDGGAERGDYCTEG